MVTTLPDIQDPYERRGVPHPHQVDDVDAGDVQVGGISGVGLAFDLHDEYAGELYEEICAREAERRGRPPGFAAWPGASGPA